MSFVTKASTAMLRKLYMGVLIVVILYSAIGNSIEYPDVPHSMKDYDVSKPISIEKDVDVESLQFDSDENIYENEYPSKQLEIIVDETMELLESDDEEKKKNLKIKPSDYRKYKPLRSMQVSKPRGKTESRVVGGADVDNGRCPAIVQEDSPKLLSDISGREHWVLNVNNMKQIVFRRTCVNNNPCGDEYTDPFSYKRVCSQITIKVPLFSIPVDEELVKENQVFSVYSFPSNCVCKMTKINDK